MLLGYCLHCDPTALDTTMVQNVLNVCHNYNHRHNIEMFVTKTIIYLIDKRA